MKTLQNHLPRFLFLVGLFIAGQALLHLTAQAEPHAIVAPGAYDGLVMQEASLEQESLDAGLIVYGAVDSVHSRADGETIVTDVTLDVAGTLRGTTGDSLTFTLPGGSIGSIGLAVGGVPNFLTGEKVLVFLNNAQDKKLVRYWQGKYTLAGSEALQVESKTRVSVRSLETRLGRSLKETVNLPEDGPSASSSPFVTSSPCPAWGATQLPVVFDVNPGSPGDGGPTGTDFARLAYASWHAWQALSNSYPAFSFGTITNRGQAIDELNTIGWADLDPGVLGINHCAWSGSTRVDSDTLIDNADFTWDADDSNGITFADYSLQAVLEHELGHGLSLGHSDQACDGSPSTPLMCPAVANGSRKVILADDQAGAAFLYPLSGAVASAPAALSATIDGSSNDLSWTASSSGSPFAYDIERSPTGCNGAFKSIETVAGSSTSYTDDNYGDGLGSGSWCYRVKALNQGGDSAYSSKVLASDTPAEPPVSYAPGSGEHQISAVAIGSDVAIFVRTSGDQLAYRQRTGTSWSAWTVIAQGAVSRPAAIQVGSSTYVFFRGTANDLRYVRRSASTWTPAVSLGGTTIFAPTAAVDGDGDLIVVASTPSGTTYFQRLSGSTWSGWISLGGSLDGRLDITARSGNLYLFGLNALGVTWYRAWSASTNSWGAWTALGGVLQTQLSATSHGPDLYFFGTNASGKTFFKSLSGSSWSGWQTLGGVMGPSVDIASTGTQLIYAAINPSGKLWSRTLTGSWTGWLDLGGAMATGPDLVQVGGQAYAFVTNPNGALYYRQWSGSTWGAWIGLGGTLAVAD